MLLKTFALTGSFQQIIPPYGENPDSVPHTGPMNWVLVNGASGTTLADDAAGDNQATLAASANPITIVGVNEVLFAKGAGTITVIGAKSA